MRTIFNPFKTSYYETMAEKFGIKAGKATGNMIKIGIFIAVGLVLGLIFFIYAMGKGFQKGFNEIKK